MEVQTDAQVKPFWGRVSVANTPVDEHQRDTGLILPFGSIEDHLVRGVVVAVDSAYENSTYAGVLQPGMIVWYRAGRRILDVTIVDFEDIYAYQETDG